MKKGFTLIEILIGIALLAILVAIVVAAINPAKRFQDARNVQRWSDVTAVLDAVYLNALDNDGTFECPADTVYVFRTSENVSSTIADGAYTDICDCLVTDYLGLMPTDPQSTHKGQGLATCVVNYNTEYRIWQSTSTAPIYVKAWKAEAGETIQVSR